MLKIFAPLAVSGGLLLAAGCTDATVIGGELVESDSLPIAFTDTVSVGFRTIQLEPVIAGGIQNVGSGTQPLASGLVFGCLSDPQLGLTQSSVGFELVPVGDRDSLRSLLPFTVDSAVLTIPLRPAFQVGDTTAQVAFEVVGAEVGTVDLEEALTDDELATTGVTFATASLVPPRDSSSVRVYASSGASNVVDVGPTIRVPLDAAAFSAAAIEPARDQLADQDEEDGDAPLDAQTYLDSFGGFIVRADPLMDCSATLPAIDLFQGRLPELGVTVYVTLRSGEVAQYRLATRRNSTDLGLANIRPSYTHDYDGSAAGEALDDGLADGLAFVQGLQGLGVEIELPVLDEGTDGTPLAINLAILEVPVLRDGFTEPIARLLPYQRDEAGNLEVISGAGSLPLAEGEDFIGLVAPYGEATDSVEVYRINLATYLQDVVDGEREPTLVLGPSTPTYDASRSTLAIDPERGAGARLLLATTELP